LPTRKDSLLRVVHGGDLTTRREISAKGRYRPELLNPGASKLTRSQLYRRA
jgi:hypothetical protein